MIRSVNDWTLAEAPQKGGQTVGIRRIVKGESHSAGW